MDDGDIVKRIIAQAEKADEVLQDNDRWNNLYSFSQALDTILKNKKDDELDAVIAFLTLILEQFPDVTPLDYETKHVQCVHYMLKTVLKGLRSYRIMLMKKGMDGPPEA